MSYYLLSEFQFSLVGLDPIDLNIVVTSPVLIAKIKMENPAIRGLGGWLIGKHNVENVGLVENYWRRIWIGKNQFVSFPTLYVPNDYALSFKATEWLSTKSFKLLIYEN